MGVQSRLGWIDGELIPGICVVDRIDMAEWEQ